MEGSERQDLASRLEGVFAGAGIEGVLYAVDVGGGRAVSHGGDALRPCASTGKVPILVTLMRAVDRGELDLDERVRIPAAGRTPGPTGLSAMCDDAELSLRDVARLMIAQSDNHATDVVLARLPPARVTATMRELGLPQTAIEITIAEMYRRSRERMREATDPETAWRLAASDPDLEPATAPWRSTPEEMSRLMAGIWRDEVASAAACAEMRAALRTYATSNGLRTGFPMPEQTAIGGKTGTLAGVNNETAVVEFRDGGRYAVTVFTRTADRAAWKFRDARRDMAVGEAAALAVAHLRAAPSTPGA